MKKTVVLSALALVAAAGTASAQTLETRILVQTITGSGATRSIANTASTSFAQGERVRLTVQYRFIGAPAGGALIGSFLFNLNGTLNSGAAGAISRSALATQNPTNSPTNQNAESRTAIDQSGSGWDAVQGPAYPQTNASLTATGLHAAGGNLRGLLSGGADTASANGTIAGIDINNILAGSSAASAATLDGNDEPLGNSWLGLYSAEYDADDAAASNVTFNIVKDPNAAVRWYANSGGNVSMPGGAFNAGQSVTLQFGSTAPINTPPVVTPANIVGSPDFTPAPDINGVLIGVITDAEGITAAQVSAAVMGTAPTNVPAFSIVQNGANEVQVFVSYEIANADLSGGPSSFMVKITANDGTALPVEGTATVNLVPAPGAAALLGLGGLLAARRRRQA